MAKGGATVTVVENELENNQEKTFLVPKSAAEVQRYKLEKLLKKSVRIYKAKRYGNLS